MSGGCCGDEMDRRGFLTRVIAGSAGLVAVVLGGGGLSYFLSPLFKRGEESWVDLGPPSAVPPGVPVKVEFVVRRRDAWATTEKRSTAWVSTPDGRRFTAFDPRCTHLGCPYRWDEAQGKFACPCHAAFFDAEGKVLSGPAPRPLDRYAAKVEKGRLLIQPEPRRGAA